MKSTTIKNKLLEAKQKLLNAESGATQLLPINKIYTDTKTFQNRSEAYSEASVIES